MGLTLEQCLSMCLNGKWHHCVGFSRIDPTVDKHKRGKPDVPSHCWWVNSTRLLLKKDPSCRTRQGCSEILYTRPGFSAPGSPTTADWHKPPVTSATTTIKWQTTSVRKGQRTKKPRVPCPIQLLSLRSAARPPCANAKPTPHINMLLKLKAKAQLAKKKKAAQLKLKQFKKNLGKTVVMPTAPESNEKPAAATPGGCPLKQPGKPRCLIRMGRTNKAGLNDITERLLRVVRIARSYGCGVRFANPWKMVGHSPAAKTATWADYYRTEEWSCDARTPDTKIIYTNYTGQPTKAELADLFRPDPEAVAAAKAAGERPRPSRPSDPLLVLNWAMGGTKSKPNYFANCQFWTCLWKRKIKYMMCPKETESWCAQPPLPYVYLGKPIIDKVKYFIDKFFHGKPFISLKIRRGDKLISYPAKTCIDQTYATVVAELARQRSLGLDGVDTKQVFVMTDSGINYMSQVKTLLEAHFDLVVTENQVKGWGDPNAKYMVLERMGHMGKVYVHVTSKFRRFPQATAPLEKLNLDTIPAQAQLGKYGYAAEYLKCSRGNVTQADPNPKINSINGIMLSDPSAFFRAIDDTHEYDVKRRPSDAFAFPRAQVPHLY